MLYTVISAVPNACHSKVESTLKTGIARATKAIVYIYRALLKPLQRWTSLEPLTLVRAYNP